MTSSKKFMTGCLERSVWWQSTTSSRTSVMGGWLDNGLHPWKRTRRQEGTGTNARRGPLLSGREHLMKSIQASTSPGQVSIENPVPYAHVHNDGAKIPVTKKMKNMPGSNSILCLGSRKDRRKTTCHQKRKNGRDLTSQRSHP